VQPHVTSAVWHSVQLDILDCYGSRLFGGSGSGAGMWFSSACSLLGVAVVLTVMHWGAVWCSAVHASVQCGTCVCEPRCRAWWTATVARPVVHHVVKELFVGRCSFQWQAVIGFVLHDVKLSNLFKINIIIVINGCWRPSLGP
jgi:hypothetical protein